MWTRQEVKSYGKGFLRNHYWKAFLVCLIVSLASGGGSSKSSNNDYNNNDNTYYNEQGLTNILDNNIVTESANPIFKFATNRIRTPLSFIGMGMISIMTITLAVLLVTVGYALEVGRSRFFLRGFEGDVRIAEVFSVFNSREYLSIVKTQFLTGIYKFLWTLLFIIPGIIKFYEYRFVPYILAEEPNLSSKEAITLSRRITNGHKMDMFVLDFSFLGWYILGALLLGVGVLFVDPYHAAAEARLYNILSGKDDSLDDSYYDNYSY